MIPIVIEGANATGKTRLSHMLAFELNKVGYNYRVNKFPRAATVTDQQNLYGLLETIFNGGLPIICDRVPFISDMIYPYIAPIHIPFKEFAKRALEKAVLIYCNYPAEAAYGNYKNRKENKEGFSFGVYNDYAQLMSEFDYIPYSYMIHKDTITQTIIRAIEKKEYEINAP